MSWSGRAEVNGTTGKLLSHILGSPRRHSRRTDVARSCSTETAITADAQWCPRSCSVCSEGCSPRRGWPAGCRGPRGLRAGVDRTWHRVGPRPGATVIEHPGDQVCCQLLTKSEAAGFLQGGRQPHRGLRFVGTASCRTTRGARDMPWSHQAFCGVTLPGSGDPPIETGPFAASLRSPTFTTRKARGRHGCRTSCASTSVTPLGRDG